MKIAVICAFPSNLNPGMLSVDLALDHFLQSCGLAAEVVRYTAEDALSLPLAGGAVHYRHLRDAGELEAYDRIVYWGDFLHWIGYARHDYTVRQRQRHPGLDPAQVLDQWYRLLLLEQAPHLHDRVIVFGSTLYGLGAAQLADERYRQALQALYARARLVQLRDVHSAAFVEQLAPQRQSAFGCDCALLLDAQRLPPAPPPPAQPYALHAFGRSDGNLAQAAFARELSIASRCGTRPLTWFDHSGFEGLFRKIALIRGARYVVTDIYHLSVTALREGVPVLCIGRGASTVRNSLSDKKKELFFGQAFAADNYLHFERLHASLNANAATRELVDQSLRALTRDDSHAFVVDALRHQAALAAQRLAHALAG